MTQYTRYLVGAALLGTLALTGCDSQSNEEEAANAAAPSVVAAPAAETAPATTPAAPVVNAANPDVIMGGEFTLGAADAPITVIEYASMTCSHCAHFHNGTPDEEATYTQVKRKYIETGMVKFIFRPFPLDGLALRASMLSSCSGPSRYEAFTKVLFAQQGQWATARDPMGELKKIARLGGMSGAAFDQCMENEELFKSIVESRQAGTNEYKIGSTPTFIIEGKLYAGALSMQQFEEALEPHLP